MLPISLGCPFLFTSSDFSNVYIISRTQLYFLYHQNISLVVYLYITLVVYGDGQSHTCGGAMRWSNRKSRDHVPGSDVTGALSGSMFCAYVTEVVQYPA